MPAMTIVHMPEKGQIVVPKNTRDQRSFGNGSTLAARKPNPARCWCVRFKRDGEKTCWILTGPEGI